MGHISLSGSNIILMRVSVLLCVNQHTKFEVRSFTNSKDMIGAKLKNGSRDPDHAAWRSGSVVGLGQRG